MNRREFIGASLALGVNDSVIAGSKSSFLAQYKNMKVKILWAEETTLGVLAPVGRPTIIHFWASWCAPCAEEMKFLAELKQKAAPNSISLLGIHLDGAGETAEKVKSYLKNNNGQNYAHINGNKNSYNLFNESGIFGRMITTLPKLFVYDRDGHKIETHSGFDEADMLKLERRVMAL
jgi:thiol-disulfide isomerase/thioredoxin